MLRDLNGRTFLSLGSSLVLLLARLCRLLILRHQTTYDLQQLLAGQLGRSNTHTQTHTFSKRVKTMHPFVRSNVMYEVRVCYPVLPERVVTRRLLDQGSVCLQAGG